MCIASIKTHELIFSFQCTRVFWRVISGDSQRNDKILDLANDPIKFVSLGLWYETPIVFIAYVSLTL